MNFSIWYRKYYFNIFQYYNIINKCHHFEEQDYKISMKFKTVTCGVFLKTICSNTIFTIIFLGHLCYMLQNKMEKYAGMFWQRWMMKLRLKNKQKLMGILRLFQFWELIVDLDLLISLWIIPMIRWKKFKVVNLCLYMYEYPIGRH